MRKRLGLFIIGLVLAIGAFVLYQFVTGASVLPTKGSDHVDVVQGPVDLAQEYQVLTPDGLRPRYVYKMKSYDLMTDPQGKPIANEYKVIKPEATIYEKNGRTIRLSADRGLLVLDQVPKRPAAESGQKGTPPFQFHTATFSGNALVTVGATPGTTGPAKPLDSEMVIACDDDVVLLQNQNLLTSDGAIHGRSPAGDFDGAGLNISYNLDSKRVEYLRILKGNKIILRNAGKMLSLEDDASKKAAGSSTTPAAVAVASAKPAATGPAAPRLAASRPAVPPTIYKLSFGQNVTVTQGTRVLDADRLYALFTWGEPDSGKDAAAVSPSAAAPGATSAPLPGGLEAAAGPSAATAAAPLDPRAPIAPPGPDDLVIHWTGPMEMRPAGAGEVTLAGPKDYALQAVGTVEHPVRLHDGARLVTAGMLWYHTDEGRLQIQRGDLPNVHIVDPVQGTVICAGVELLRKTQTIELAGPGSMEVPQEALRREAVDEAGGARGAHPHAAGAGAGGAAGDETPLAVSWNVNVELQWVDVPDVKNPGKMTQAIRHAVLTGDVAAHDATFDLKSKALDLLIAYTRNVKTPQALEHMLATGNVRFKNARPGFGLEDADNPDTLTANRLEVKTAPRPDTQVPAPSEILATGDVVASTWSAQNNNATAPDSADKVAASKHLVHEVIYTPTLDIACAPREKTGAAEVKNAAASGASAGLLLGSGIVAKSVKASDGVKVELDGFEGSAGRLITATAQTLSADPQTGNAVLDGAPAITQPGGIPKPVTIAQGGDNQIVSDQVLLDQKTRAIEVPGPGSFNFVEPGKNGEPDGKVAIVWSRKMNFDDKTHTAVFIGHVDTKMTKPDQLSTMTCEESLTVVLNPESVSKAAGAAAKSGGNDSANRLRSLVAMGDVYAVGETFEPGTQKILTAMNLRAAEVHYSGDTKILSIPTRGTLTLEDYRIAKANLANAAKAKKGPDGKGVSAFIWGGFLNYDGNTGIITMNKNVGIIHEPLKPFHLPGADGAAREVSKIDLSGQKVTAYLVQSRDQGGGKSVSNPMGLGSGGDMKIARAVIDENARLIMGDDEVAGYTLDFDAIKNIAVVIGKDGIDAKVSQLNKGINLADKITWNLETDDLKMVNSRGAFQMR